MIFQYISPQQTLKTRLFWPPWHPQPSQRHQRIHVARIALIGASRHGPPARHVLGRRRDARREAWDAKQPEMMGFYGDS